MIKKVKSWQEFKTLIADNSQLEWIYRGQANSNWAIRSSLERSGIMTHYDEGEERMLHEFKRASRYYLQESEIPRNLIDWTALLQHHGTPTRLIDFTKSPYIAAFFSFEDSIDYGEYVSVWIANKIFFYRKAIYYLQNNGFQDFNTKFYAFRDKSFKKIYNESKIRDLDCIIPIESHLMNERYYLQQSIFLSPTNPSKPFTEQLDFLGDICNYALIQILIPRTERDKALRDLEKMNITHASLFPGLDGFARSLKLKFSTLSSVSDISKSIKILQNEKLIK